MDTEISGEERAMRNGYGLPNQRAYEARTRACNMRAGALVAALGELESLLVLTNEVLKVSQPPINNKLGVQWWIPRGGALWRDPFLVKWRQLRTGRWRAYEVKHLHPNMVRREGNSKYGAEATLDLARMTVRLIAAYKEIRGVLLAIAGRARVPTKLTALLAEARFAVSADHEDVMNALIAAGYEIDAKTMTLTQHLYAAPD
jgi:hypothetical protein